MKSEDTRLIRKVLKGDRAATRQLYGRHEQRWFRLCLRYGRNRNEGQDLFQEGVARVFEMLKKYDAEKGSFKSWSSKVIVNAALQFLRRNPWEQSFQHDWEGEMQTPETIVGDLSARELTTLIQQLPTGYRLVFNLYEIEGYTHREIAEMLHISEGTSKSQLAKARKALQRKLKVLL